MYIIRLEFTNGIHIILEFMNGIHVILKFTNGIHVILEFTNGILVIFGIHKWDPCHFGIHEWDPCHFWNSRMGSSSFLEFMNGIHVIFLLHYIRLKLNKVFNWSCSFWSVPQFLQKIRLAVVLKLPKEIRRQIGAVVVAQLVERSLPTPEVRGLIPVIGKLLYWTFICLLSNVLKRRK